ncbi:hybrid sensor histidine kinase/response regulator [Pseudanabaena sp. ABRG5-3]|uniref:hybrid sensor histidine kinase/response regulator n=1 Tax=Pseudanabaena sp. ABRG5-3 TaxID=685565 RepID=UPI000DC6E341|nr:hybrid sensor histidine kinase/response regulator [Pseudanabaena sp. ABRG5-3]BBC24395.1 chemotaxis protein [Pseudanabaena sp. ABRG5-3]
MYSTETEIHDQAYQFFKQEAPEFLQTIETGLLSLREDRSTNNIHAIMRAAHSIKGGSASLNLEGIKTIAHQLEDVFRSLYRFEGEIDADLEGLLLQAYDCLRLPLMDQLQSGHYEEASAIETAEPIFEVLKLYLGDTDEDTELPTAAELGVDIVQIVFDGDVQQGILRLQNVLDNPEGVPVKGEIRAQVEVFSGIGELLNLSGFQAIAHATLQALEHHPDNPILVGKVAIANFVAARAEVLAGDRAQGGQPSPELIALTQTNQSPTVQSPASQPQQSVVKPNDNPPNLDLVFDIEESDDQWFQSLEQELNIFSSANLDLEDTSPSFLEVENLPSPDLSSPDLNLDLKGATNLDLQNFEQLSYDSLDEIISPETDSEIIDKSLETEEFESFDSLNLNLEDLNFEDINLEENLDQNFEVFSARLDDKNDDLELNIFDIADDIVEVSQLSDFFGEQESVLGETPSKSDQYLADLEINAITQNLIAPPTPIISTASSIIQSKTAIANSKNVTTNVTTTTTSKKNPKNLEKAAPYISETIRVDLSRLERLNNFSSELVTQENASILHHQQLQAKIERLQKQFKGFENLSKNLQTWLDKAQRSQVRTQNFSPVSSLNLFNKPQLAETLSNTANFLADFDPLQMDSYNRLYGVIQEALEEIAQMDEGMRDMTVLMQQTYQTQRRKQQILKQVRYDLLWSRMLPLGDILTSLPRMVREMSNKYNKQVNLKMFGTGTLVDKSVLEKLYDPFVHLVRNAFDHGTESTQERLERGKPVIASIEIRAYYRGNQTYIEIKDDGHGINLEKVKSKAITVGLLKPEKADQLTNEEVYQLLFEPSFSTAEVVSELSGRGMGLSTVQEQVRSLKGSIEIKSEVGQGTTFIIKLPLTLSIAKLLIFSIQDRLLAIPIDTLLGINTVDEDAIQNIQGEKFYRFENRLIPLYPTSIFEDGYPLPKKSIELLSTEAFTDEEQTTLLLLSNGDEIFALPIDRVLNEQELAIKPFGKAIAPPPYLYGCTILGDGTLVPVIDSTALLSNKQSKTTSRSTSSNLPSASNQSISTKTQLQPIQRKTILIVDDSLTTRQALYLTLEKFGYQIIQAVDGREALDQLSRSTEIQAVLCDVEMPNMNGFEFLTACRKESRFAHLPIVMVTSRGGAKHRGVAQMLGASGYLTKPYLEQELIKTLQNLLPKL